MSCSCLVTSRKSF
nr:unnamed protein product [Callosobruchus analis]